MTKRIRKRLFVGLLLAIAVYAAMAAVSDSRALLDVLTEFDWWIFIGALGLSLLNYAIRFVKWHLYLKTIEIDVDAGLSLLVFISGMSMSVTPGKLGEVLKSGLLKRLKGLRLARTAPVVFAERITDLLGLCVLAAAGAVAFDYGRQALVFVVLAVICFVVLVQQPKWVAWLLDMVAELPGLGRFREPLSRSYESTRDLLAVWPLIWGTLLSVVSWGMEATAFYLICVELGSSGSILTTTFIFSLTTILGAVSFLPGGLGVTEGTMMGALVFFSVFAADGSAAAATYLIRFATLWFGVVLGFVALGFLRAKFPGVGEVGAAAEDDLETD